MKNVPGTKSRF